MSARALGIAIALSTLLSANVSRAATPEEKAMADALFQHGRTLLGSGNVKEACPKLAESQRIDPQIGTLLYLATCHEQEGRIASAHAEFNEALALLARAPQREREQYARERIAALAQRLSHLVVSVEAPSSELDVRLDGKSLGAPAFGTPLPVDPGTHEVTAAAPQKRTWKQSVDITSAPRKIAILVPPLDDERAPVVSTPAPAPSEQHDERTRGTRTVAGFTVLGIGIAGLAVGTVFGVRTIDTKAEADGGPCVGHFCNERGLALYDDARGYATISTIAFGVGAVALATGLYLVKF